MFNDLIRLIKKPDLFQVASETFWNDEHISKELLKAHIEPNADGASRNHLFIDKSAQWITEKTPSEKYKRLLDLGCGPGLYSERFAREGYDVTGIDFSKRSIEYAKNQSARNSNNIKYIYMDYLTMDYKEEFDIVTLIYCDLCALSTEDRVVLLNKIYRALKPGGKFILDVFSTVSFKNKKESHTWEYCDKGGFWSEKPYISLNSVYHYDEDNTELRQSIVKTENSLDCYNVWEHYFTKESFLRELQETGFGKFELYGDVAGKKYSDTGEIICGVFEKM